ncbi:hypothetical protein WJX74_010773 [Apatococcus lobatus]|uniref:Uncharacterized protein n=1 Tax=Apatococcus lobatus TaxID=904363 RepID=A0AAW1R0U7_9CHLO
MTHGSLFLTRTAPARIRKHSRLAASLWPQKTGNFMDHTEASGKALGELHGKPHQLDVQAGSNSDTQSPDTWEMVSPTEGGSPSLSRRSSLEARSSHMKAVPAAEGGEASAAAGHQEDSNADLDAQGSQNGQAVRTTAQLSPAQAPGSSAQSADAGPSSLAQDNEVQDGPAAIRAAPLAPSEDEADEEQVPAAASSSPTSAFSYSHAGLPGSGHGSSSFEHAGHDDDDASSNDSSWDQASGLSRADSGKPRSEPDSEEALSELQDMSSEGPLSSTEHAAPSLQVHEPTSPSTVQSEEAAQAAGDIVFQTNNCEASGDADGHDEEDSARASLLSLDPETARAAQDVLNSEAELSSELGEESEMGSPAGSISGASADDGAGPPKKRQSASSRAFQAILAWFQEGVRWLSAFLPAGLVQKVLQQAQQAMALAYARPYTALTALSGSIVVVGLLMHNRSLQAQLRASTGEVKSLQTTLAKMHEAAQQLNTSGFPILRHTASLIPIRTADRSFNGRLASLSVFV